MGPQMTPDPHIVVAGAGAIGCFVGGLLAASGHSVTLLGRASVLDQIADEGLRLTDFSGLDVTVHAQQLGLTADPDCLSDADLVLVSVKTGATDEMAAEILKRCNPAAPVVSLQNGLDAIEMLTTSLPGYDVRAGMVPFNVIPRGAGWYHRAVSGDILIGAGSTGDLGTILSVDGLSVRETERIRAIQWGKLVVNLNNALNALSGLTILDQLLNTGWRRLMADQMAEALRVLRANNIDVQTNTPLPARLIPMVMRLPTGLFRRIAAQMKTIDPTARTSMSYDLAAGKLTEVDALQGAIVELGRQAGVPTPINSRVMELIHLAEHSGGTTLEPRDIIP